MNTCIKTVVISLLLILFSPMAKLSAQISTWDGTWEPWTHGTGTEADPFLIENAQQLAYLAYRVNNGLDGNPSNHDYNYKLMVDVDLNGSENFQWTPIGYWNSNTGYQHFGGQFNGNGHIISGLYINNSSARVGFFGSTDGASVEHLTVRGHKIATSNGNAGGLIGVAQGTIAINDCCSSFTNGVSGTSGAGGIMGLCMASTARITNCYNTGNISANTFGGGILGKTECGDIINCYNTGSITSEYSGGIIGQTFIDNHITLTITSCYNTGNLTMNYNGGVVGQIYFNYYGGICSIKNCYNIGNMSSGNNGGIVGIESHSQAFGCHATITNCYYLNTCGGSNSYGQPMSSDAMKSQEFVELLNDGSCAWEYDGANTNLGYPILTMILITTTTSDTTEITQTHATLHGTIEVENTSIMSQGFEYKKTIDSNYQTVTVSGGGDISYTIYNLVPNTQYQYRTFCETNDACGMTYSEEKSFTTLQIGITTNNASEITQSHATLYGNIDFGDASITSRGFEYKKIVDSQYQTINVSGSGNISTILSGLQPSTQYQYRTFCTPTDCSTYYGEIKTFTTLPISITTDNASNITQTFATLNGNLNMGDANVIAQGFEYKQSSAPNYQTISVSGNGNVSHTLSGLMPNASYTYRAFCTVTGCGTTYGETRTFTTLPVSVTTNFATDVTANCAVLHGYMDIGDATLVSKGFEYRAVGATDFTTVNVEGNDNDFDAQLTNLQLNTTYEYRAFMDIAESPTTYYGTIRTFEVTWLNQDTIYISDADMLRWVSEQCNSGTTFEGKCIKLINDITLPLNVPNNMTSIGVYPNYPFKGTFDGNGKLITNLYIDQPNTPYQGFFGYTLNANLYNVGLVNITASGRNYTGGMVAYAENTYMRDCYVNGGTLFALSYCGGLVGYQEQGTNSIISGCYNTCEVTGNNYVGGLIGFSNYSTVRNSYVAGRVAAQGEPVGAIIGGANEVLMYYCYFSTELTGQTNAIGWNNIGKDGGEGLTNAQMRDPQFVNTLNQNLATPVWMADYAIHINNGFPIIKWQRPGTGVEEHDAIMKTVSLYPNPANHFVTIQSDEPNVSLKYVEIYDITGRKVMSAALEGQNQELGINKLLSGVYHVRVQTNNGCYTNLKLVVQ